MNLQNSNSMAVAISKPKDLLFIILE